MQYNLHVETDSESGQPIQDKPVKPRRRDFGIVLAILAYILLYFAYFFWILPHNLKLIRMDAIYFTGSIFPEILDKLPALLLLLAGTALLAFSFSKYPNTTSITFVFTLIIVGVLSAANFDPIPYKRQECEAKQNLHAIQLTLVNYAKENGGYPIRLSDVKDKNGRPLCLHNAFGSMKTVKKHYDSRNSKVLGSDWDAFKEFQASHFNADIGAMHNLATGYETGHDYIEWWNCYPAEPNDDSRRIATRAIVAGCFLYFPANNDENYLPYNTKETKAVFGNLYTFGHPENGGLDVWTPTGDPNMPIKMEPDGINDGVIIYLNMGGELGE